jgi:hypothetical protein
MRKTHGKQHNGQSAYAAARFTRDLEAIANGTFLNRLFNRALAKAAGKALRPYYRPIKRSK